MGNSLEFVSWKGKGAMIFGFDSWNGGGWQHQSIPMEEDWETYVDSLVRIGIRTVSQPGARAIVFCWPSFLPLALLFLIMEGTWWLRRRRKHKADPSLGTGIASDHD